MLEQMVRRGETEFDTEKKVRLYRKWDQRDRVSLLASFSFAHSQDEGFSPSS